MHSDITTFIIPSIDRPTLRRAFNSARKQAAVLYKIDTERIGESAIRNELIKKAKTPWVSMLDDDDCVTADYVQRLEEEAAAHPEADVILFREYFPPEDKIIPLKPVVEWGNIGISFSVRRSVAMEFPFIEQPYEDYEFIKRLEAAGKKLVFSKYITYRFRH